ncbi:MAG: phenylacetate--CoA ligase family protein [Candidatus Eremiobacteraeota bacterium]|nr:phenylacetate--CoA ligase family protein [Candidatus Eremiobacteraeota bacterium]
MIASPAAAWPPVYDPAYRPRDDQPYWDRARETMSADERAAHILQKVQALMAWAWERAPFYRAHWRMAGLEPGDVRSLDDFARVPTISKADLRADQAVHPPFGSYLCVEPHEVARVHGTSGTSGRPTAFAWTRDDYARIAEAHARIMWSFGLRPSDLVFVGSIFSLYVGSWGTLAGVERLGAASFPFGAGVPGMTLQALSWMQQMRPSAFYGTPSYALRLAETARAEGIDPQGLGLRLMFFSGEPGAGIPAMKQLIQETFGAACIDTGSMGEVTPWMNVAECAHRTGMHLWQDLVYAELLDPQTLRPLPFGATGTPVYTQLERRGQPMIRLVSGDLAEWTDAPCPCGRTYPRFPRGIVGRIDDMLVIRGENIYPSAVEEVLRAFAEVGTEFEIVVTRPRALDELTVRAELVAPCDEDALRERIVARMKRQLGIRPEIAFAPAGTLARTDLKSRRVRDERDHIAPTA